MKTPTDFDTHIVGARRSGEWLQLAYNSAIGDLANAMTSVAPDFRNALVPDEVKRWEIAATDLLSVQPPLVHLATSCFARNASYFFANFRRLAEEYLLPCTNAEFGDHEDAFWSGFFYSEDGGSVELFRRLKPSLVALAQSDRSSQSEYMRPIAVRTIGAWAQRSSDTDERLISDHEMRRILLRGGESLRKAILHQFSHEIQFPEQHAGLLSSTVFIDFMGSVWPLQRQTRTPETTEVLFEITFHCGDDFCLAAAAVRNHLTKIDNHHFMFPEPLRSGGIICRETAPGILSLLEVVLPANRRNRPLDSEQVLKKVREFIYE